MKQSRGRGRALRRGLSASAYLPRALGERLDGVLRRGSIDGASGVPRIAFLGGFGGGNIGNEASLCSAIQNLESHGRESVLVVTPYPAGTRERLGFDAVSIQQRPAAVRRIRSRVARVVLYGLAEGVRVARVVAIVRGVDAVVVPGTGILDDFGEKPWRMPYSLLTWTLAARLVGRPFSFLCVGAGPIRSRASRLLMVTAARLATYISYRDEQSRAFLVRVGGAALDGPVMCDIAFAHSLPLPACSLPTRTPTMAIGVAVMGYGGWDGANSGSVYERYVDLMTEVVTRAVRNGDVVHFLVGEAVDREAVDAVLARCRTSVAAACLRPEISDYSDLLAAAARMDVVVATRYHAAIAAVTVRRPVISVGYAEKFAALLGDFGLRDFHVMVEDADAEWVWERVEDLRSGRRGLGANADVILERNRRLARREITRAGVRRGSRC